VATVAISVEKAVSTLPVESAGKGKTAKEREHCVNSETIDVACEILQAMLARSGISEAVESDEKRLRMLLRSHKTNKEERSRVAQISGDVDRSVKSRINGEQTSSGQSRVAVMFGYGRPEGFHLIKKSPIVLSVARRIRAIVDFGIHRKAVGIACCTETLPYIEKLLEEVKGARTNNL
jgi:hypothetical protein